MKYTDRNIQTFIYKYFCIYLGIYNSKIQSFIMVNTFSKYYLILHHLAEGKVHLSESVIS